VIETTIVYAVIILLAFGLSYWAYRAQGDRSARVGLLLLFGFPGGLIAVAGLVMAVTGRSLGPPLLAFGLAMLLPLLTPVRRVIARITPIEPTSAVDMTGLCILLPVIAVLLVQTASNREPPDSLDAVRSIDLVLQAIFEAALAFAAVGWPVARSLTAAVRRLGLVRPTWRTPVAAVGFLVAAFILYAVVGVVAQIVQPEIFDELNRVTNDLTAGVQNPWGAALLGMSAGIGEEAIFRGALQPRFGIPLTSVAFALLHAPQYGFSLIILGLFMVSVVLGVERQRYGTSASMITHALYNFVAVLAQ